MTTFVETDCTFEHKGRKFTSGGAYYDDGNRAVGYVGKLFEPRAPQPHCRALTDWRGNQIGTCYLSKGWRVNSGIGLRLYQIYATIDGVRYTGRGFGEGMIVNLRRCAKQPT